MVAATRPVVGAEEFSSMSFTIEFEYGEYVEPVTEVEVEEEEEEVEEEIIEEEEEE